MDTYNCGGVGRDDTDWPDFIEQRLILCPDHISILSEAGEESFSLLRTKYFDDNVKNREGFYALYPRLYFEG